MTSIGEPCCYSIRRVISIYVTSNSTPSRCCPEFKRISVSHQKYNAFKRINFWIDGGDRTARLTGRVIHEKSNFKFLTSSSVILFIKVIKYIMQNFSNFEKSLEGATSLSSFVHNVNEVLEIKMFPVILGHL